MNMPNNLTWTSQGTVDRKRTAEVLVKDESVDIIDRFKLACFYCLKNDILLLWSKLTYTQKISLHLEDDLKEDRRYLVIFWICYLNGEVDKLNKRSCTVACSPYQRAFEAASFCLNKVAAEYFFAKLTSQEREKVLVRLAIFSVKEMLSCSVFTCLGRIDLLSFLLSQMDKEQQIEVFKNCVYYILKWLLEWPWQDLFLETAERMWNFLSEHGYDHLLSNIITKIKLGEKDYNYQKLFTLFWQKSPDTHKKYAIDKFSEESSLTKLFENSDIDNILLILRSATVAQKEEIIFSYNGKRLCELLIFHDNWDLLQLFLQACISSKLILIKFKEEFKEYMCWPQLKEAQIEKHDVCCKFSQLLDNLLLDDKMRSIEDGKSSAASKEFCT